MNSSTQGGCCEKCRQVFKSGLVHCLGITTCPCHNRCKQCKPGNPCEEHANDKTYTPAPTGEEDCKHKKAARECGLILPDGYICRACRPSVEEMKDIQKAEEANRERVGYEHATPEQKKEIMKEVIRGANEDQQKVLAQPQEEWEKELPRLLEELGEDMSVEIQLARLKNFVHKTLNNALNVNTLEWCQAREAERAQLVGRIEGLRRQSEVVEGHRYIVDYRQRNETIEDVLAIIREIKGKK